MRKVLLVAFLSVCLVGLFVLSLTAGKDYKKQGKKWWYCECLQDAETEISNIENGVVIKVTSDKPEIIKMIQEHSSKYMVKCKYNYDKSTDETYKKDKKDKKCKENKKDKEDKDNDDEDDEDEDD